MALLAMPLELGFVVRFMVYSGFTFLASGVLPLGGICGWLWRSTLATSVGGVEVVDVGSWDAQFCFL